MNSTSSYVVKKGKVYLGREFVTKDILVVDGIVKEIGDNLEADVVIDASNKLVTPSFIDGHVHFRSPGFEHKEDIVTGSTAALKGGYSHIIEMANTNPILDNVEVIQSHLQDIKEQALMNVKPFSACTLRLLGKELVDVDAIAKLDIAGFSDDGKGIQDGEMMKKILIEAGKYGYLVSAHCEDEEELGDVMGAINEGETSQKLGIKGINNKSEWGMIERDLNICREIKDLPYHYHVCHISTKESFDLIKKAKDEGINVTSEVTVHHLISDETEIVSNDSNYKMNPPLRTRKDVDALVAGLNAGDIDCIVTDHAPHSEKEKDQPIERAPFGIIGLELAFSLLNTYLVKTGKVELETILNAMVNTPRTVFNLDNELKEGKPAYLNIIDLDKKITYKKEDIKSKSTNTFYLDRELDGVIETTIFKDKIYNW